VGNLFCKNICYCEDEGGECDTNDDCCYTICEDDPDLNCSPQCFSDPNPDGGPARYCINCRKIGESCNPGQTGECCAEAYNDCFQPPDGSDPYCLDCLGWGEYCESPSDCCPLITISARSIPQRITLHADVVESIRPVTTFQTVANR
jgi:hypothetical protein